MKMKANFYNELFNNCERYAKIVNINGDSFK